MTKKLLYILLVLFLISCSNKEQSVKRKTISMGTTIEIQVDGADEQLADKAIRAAFQEVERLNQKYSTYIDSNYMWKINNSGVGETKVDDETFFLLKKCDKIYKETEGGFDPAIGKFIDVLGFEKDNPHLPTPQEIKSALDKVGWKHITLIEPNILKKDRPVKLNFGAVVKGYAVDRMAKVIEDYGIKELLVNAGGEIRAEGREWNIGIQHPRKRNELLGTLVIKNKSIATSGDYEQYFKKGSKRYNHIINPKTGYPAVETEAVTIIADDVLTADALATGIFVEGPKEGLKIIESLNNIEGLIIDSSGTAHESSGFDKFFRR